LTKRLEPGVERVQADPNAIVARRLFESLTFHPAPNNVVIGDAAQLRFVGTASVAFCI